MVELKWSSARPELGTPRASSNEVLCSTRLPAASSFSITRSILTLAGVLEEAILKAVQKGGAPLLWGEWRGAWKYEGQPDT